MKNSFRMIGAVCMATAMGISFTACSDDDETEMIEKPKRLVEHSEIGERTINGQNYNYNYKTKFTYDDDGRLAMTTGSYSTDIYPDDDIYYTWGSNELTIDNAYSTYTLPLNDNDQLASLVDGHYVRRYNEFNQLIEVSSTDDRQDYQVFTWQDGKLLRKTEFWSESWSGSPSYTTYKYSGKTCKGWLPNLKLEYFADDELFLAHPEVYGLRTNQLPDQEYTICISTRTDSHYDSQIRGTQTIEHKHETTTEYDYEFYPDGYLKSYTETTTRVYTRTYSFYDKNNDGVISPDERNVTETEESTDTPRLYTFKWE